MTAKAKRRVGRRIVKAQKDLEFHRERLKFAEEHRDEAKVYKDRLRYARMALNCQVLIKVYQDRIETLTRNVNHVEPENTEEAWTPRPYEKSGVVYNGSVLGIMA